MPSKKVTIIDVVCDIYKVLDSHNKQAFILLLAMVITLQAFCCDFLLLYSSSVSATCMDICPKLIAFSMAVYVFLLKVSNDIKEKMKERSDDLRKPDQVFFATCIWFMFHVLVLYLVSLVARRVTTSYVIVALYTWVVYIIWLFFDVLLNMFSFHTFIYGMKEEKKNNIEDTNEHENYKQKLLREVPLCIYFCILVYCIYEFFNLGSIKALCGAEINIYMYLAIALSLYGLVKKVKELRRDNH